MYIIKASGEKARFDERKVRRTCLRAGADVALTNEIIAVVKKQLYNGITTQEILRLVLSLLKKTSPAVATRYNLKKAVLRLGPSGFIFEKFILHILRTYGYSAELPEIIRGACVNHEVDIVAAPSSVKFFSWEETRQKNLYMIECKYHNAPGIRSGLKHTLCVWARFLDLQDGGRKGYCEKFDVPWLVSNTKFSESAIAYARCKQMKLLGWRYPQTIGLEYLIEKSKVYPITILRNLDHGSKERLFSRDIILCSDLISIKKNILQRKTGIKDTKLTTLINEARLIV